LLCTLLAEGLTDKYKKSLKNHYSELTFILTTTAQVHSAACEAIHISNTNNLHPHLLPFKHTNVQFYVLFYKVLKTCIKDHMEDLHINGRIFKWILVAQDRAEWGANNVNM
jgi:hypothetical protein